MENPTAPIGSGTRCDICDCTFSKPYNLRRHQLRIHGIEFEELTQKNSNLSQKNSNLSQKNSNLSQKNSNLVSSDYENTLQCDKCCKTFTAHWYLVKHKEKCKGKNNAYQCEYCNCIFKHEKSRFRHYKTCKEKLEAEAKTVTIKNHCQEADVINNTHIENQNNHTQNIILVYKPENMEFIKDHIGESALDYIKKIYPNIDQRMMVDYSKRILDLPENRCIKKDDLKVGYSDVHIGENQWEKTSDEHVYPVLACSLANDMSSYINERRSKMKKDVFEKVIGFVDYMSDKGYMSTDDKSYEKKMLKEFKVFVKELKMVVFNKTK
jgi:hypothetical protein